LKHLQAKFISVQAFSGTRIAGYGPGVAETWKVFLEKRWVLLTILITGLILGLWQSLAFALEYIPPEKRQSLKSDFDAAKPLSEANGKWVCDLFGVRSNLRVARGLRLYSFVLTNGVYENKGAQVVHAYKASDGEMRGSNEQVEDLVRQSKDGRLLSRLTNRKTNDVVAYSVCNRS
jgi:hypothetical protein